MKDHVALVHQLGHRGRVMNALDRVMEPGMPAHVADVVNASGREVVEYEHLLAPLEIGIGQVRPDESRPAGDEHAHQSTAPEESPRAEESPGLYCPASSTMILEEPALSNERMPRSTPQVGS